jgi:predicted PurR-regulated permease PerM
MNGFSEKYRSLGFATLVGLLLLLAFLMLRPFFPAILWASVLSVLVTPIHRRIRGNYSPNVGALITTLITLAIIGVPIALVGLMVFFQINAFLGEMRNAAPVGEETISLDFFIREMDASLKPMIERLAPNFSLSEWFAVNKDELIRNLTGPAGKIAVGAGYSAFTLVIAFLTMFFMLRDGERLREPALDFIPLPREAAANVLARLSDTIRAVFVGIVLVAIIQGTIAGLTYYLVGVPHALLWGVATIVLCTIPLVGAPILYIPIALILIAQGKYTEAVILLAVGFVVVSQIDNLLRPFIIGAKVDLHPMAVFFSLLGGVFLLGPAGIMAGPMILSVLLAVSDVIRERVRLSREPVPGSAASG